MPETTDLDAGEPDPTGTGAAGRSPRRSVRTQRWMRWLHVYTSMISLLLVLFFGLTGLTLNHPTWTFGDDPSRDVVDGTLPAEVLPTADAAAASGDADSADVDFLAVSEYVRDEFGVHGSVTDYGVSGDQGAISYKAAGYAADITFDVATGAFTLVVDQQGLVGVMNDLHKGRDTGSSWSWVIDVAAVVLVVVALTGLAIQLVYRKRRRTALALAGAFAAVSIVLMVIGRG